MRSYSINPSQQCSDPRVAGRRTEGDGRGGGRRERERVARGASGRSSAGHHTNNSLLANEGLLVDHVLINDVLGKEVEDRLRVRGVKLRLPVVLQRRSWQGQGTRVTARGSERPSSAARVHELSREWVPRSRAT